MSPRFNAKSVAALAAAAALPLSLAGPVSVRPADLFKRDPPPALPSCATEGDLKWQPVLDFDTDGCYNTPAIGPDGTLAEGLDNCYTGAESGCRDQSDLDGNNVYARSRCNNGWCAHMYGYYFEKDVALEHVCGVGAGHRHDWEHVVVWVQDDQIRYIAASAHGDYDCRPVEDVRMEGDHPKIVYHKGGAGTHSLRFANEDDDGIENHLGVWFQGALVSYNGFPEGLRDKMIGNDWGSAAIDFSDDRFADALESAKGGREDIGLDTGSDDDSSPGQPEC
ncbi:hypothetical protein ACRE_021160 [Hapsidospora chrysogenum ATCC 11550]|uniref:Necrosis inducing protein (NPP1) n=1 Tax=Hapsidospora chrysogenum (strain ATCC 11550 / CBS 779.69 / DSM 880 / IAM 14645 / JCM 23072 / IMI 49137) TaxID=857340 RepID=A0A086TCC4_HAPC1|nr:hypothetical protein ACRE_021160 [Hapsidospora chrysogenum ATCC 11550]